MLKTDYDTYQFQTVHGEKIEDIIQYINEQLIHEPDSEIYVGVDSKVKAKSTYYAIVIGLRYPGRGAHIIYAEKHGPKYDVTSLGDRLRHEVNYAADIGVYLTNNLSKPVHVHVDINPDPGRRGENKSNIVYRYATGYLKGAGLDYATKPEAFMAMRAADFLTYANNRY